MQHELGKIVWLIGETEAAPPCPVCGDDRPKTQVLETASLIEVHKTDPIRIVECPRCHTRYCTDLDVFEYELGANYQWSARFYVEQGAALDDLIDPIARLPEGGIESCLEIGCGFGFSLDAGRTLFGWRSVGVDPSPLARLGREALDIDIRPIYADVDTELGGPFDLVYGSEVIEHVAAPRDFLKICRAHLAPGGTLILSTPRGDVLGPDLSPALLMPILSPGHHLILFNAQSLDELVRTAGFTHTQVVVRAHNLMIYASDRPLAIDASKPLDRALYRSYLTAVLAKPGRPPELRTGLTYRLFKDLVNSGLYDDALYVFDDIVRDCRERFGWELSPAAAEKACAKVRKVVFDVPFCLPGIYFFRGVIALNGSPAPGEAAAWFDAALLAAQAFRTAYATVGIDDGETGEVEQVAPDLSISSLCFNEPNQAVERLVSLARTRPSLAETTAIRLLDLGHLEQAAEAAALSESPAAVSLIAGCIHSLSGRYEEAHAALNKVVRSGGPLADRALAADLLPLASIDPEQAVSGACRLAATGISLDNLFLRLVDIGHLQHAQSIEWTVENSDNWEVLGRRGTIALLTLNDDGCATERLRKAFADAAAGSAKDRWCLAYRLLLLIDDHPSSGDRSQLAAMLAKPGIPFELRSGLTYRMFRDLVNGGLYAEASAVFEDIARDFRESCNLELLPEAADQISIAIREPNFSLPFCLPGSYFFKGIVILNASQTPGEAAAWFDAAIVVTEAFRAAYDSVGIDDGETGEIERLAPELALLALCHSAPEEAVNRGRHLARKGTRPDAMFCRLVDLGQLEQAETIEWAVDDSEDWQVIERRGMLALLKANDGRRAAELFAGAIANANTRAVSPEERWRLAYRHLLALLRIPDIRGARLISSEFLASTDVPADIRADVDMLLSEHPEARPIGS